MCQLRKFVTLNLVRALTMATTDRNRFWSDRRRARARPEDKVTEPTLVGELSRLIAALSRTDEGRTAFLEALH